MNRPSLRERDVGSMDQSPSLLFPLSLLLIGCSMCRLCEHSTPTSPPPPLVALLLQAAGVAVTMKSSPSYAHTHVHTHSDSRGEERRGSKQDGIMTRWLQAGKQTLPLIAWKTGWEMDSFPGDRRMDGWIGGWVMDGWVGGGMFVGDSSSCSIFVWLREGDDGERSAGIEAGRKWGWTERMNDAAQTDQLSVDKYMCVCSVCVCCQACMDTLASCRLTETGGTSLLWSETEVSSQRHIRFIGTRSSCREQMQPINCQEFC